MAVVMQHFSATAQSHADVVIPSLVPHGYLAVDLFFVLSGFIMSYTYLHAFEQSGSRAFGDFLGKRIARIVPLNVSVLVLFVLLGHASIFLLDRNIIYASDDLPFDLLANLLMLQGLGVGANLNGPSWSVSTEFAAYLLFPAFVFAVFHRRVVVWGLTLFCSVILLCLLASMQPRLGLATGPVGEGVLRCFAEFIMGMGAYRLFMAEPCRRVLRRDTVAFGLIAACVAFMGLRLDLPAALLFPLLIASLALNRGHAARLMSLRALHFLGAVSFSVYMIHQLFRPIELEILRAFHPVPLGAPAALLFAFLGSLSVVPFAWVTYRCVERPGRGFVRAMFARSGSVAVAV